jgi:uncharacterized protein
MPTLHDIAAELRKPGRDPRSSFELPAFRDDVTELKDLTPGMVLEGVVTNVVAFGAFVDIGVHQDGLVHVSQLADRYVADAAQVVRVGQRVRVTVVSVDLERGRVALTMRSGAPGARRDDGRKQVRRAETPRPEKPRPEKPQPEKPRPEKPRSFAPGEVAPNGMRFK